MLLNKRNGWLGWWPEDGWSAIFDPENARVKSFVLDERNKITGSALVLDAGAGHKPYKFIFDGIDYESTDMPEGFYEED